MGTAATPAPKPKEVHTPGPWLTRAERVGFFSDVATIQYSSVQFYHGEGAARIRVAMVTGAMTEADRRLIQTSPDLLDALRAIVDNAILLGIENDPRIAAARVAITKATGEPS